MEFLLYALSPNSKISKVNSRLLINNKPILFKRIMDHSGNFIASKTVEQFGIRFEKSLDELDLVFITLTTTIDNIL